MSGLPTELLTLMRRFLDWWLAELTGLMPEGIRKRLQGTAETLVFVSGESDVSVYLQSRTDLKRLGRLETRPETHPVERLRRFLEGRGLARAAYGGRLGVCVRIPAAKGARTIVDLPLAAEENLDDVVSFELNRYTPFSSDQAVFSHRVLGRDMAARRLQVELVVVPNVILEQYIKVAHELDLEPDRIDVAEPNGFQAASGNLIRSRATRGRDRVDVLTYVLGALVACLAGAALYLPVYAAQQRADFLARQFAERKASIEAVAKLEHEVEVVRRENNFLLDRKRARPSASELLFDTTHLLPDDTWLQDWQLNGRQLLLTGYARSASALVPLLEKSSEFSDTNFRSPVMQDPRTGRERFNIAVDIAPKGKP